MKKIYIIVLTSILPASFCLAQAGNSKVAAIASKDSTKSAQSKDLIRTANDLKSGNWQDVMSSFFQLAAGDLTGNNHSINFKTNLFALKVKADSTLLIDTNYVRQKFSRNFQFDFSLQLDSVYHFNGFKAGFTWAIVNKRDSSVVQFINDYSLKFNRELENNLLKFRNSLTNLSPGPGFGRFKSPEDSLVYSKVKKAIDDSLAKGAFFSSVIPKDFRNSFLDTLFSKADSALNESLKKVARQPLLTLSANGNFDKQKSLLNGGGAELVYLQGVSGKSSSRIESDIRASITEKDTTISSTNVRRTVMDCNGGFNFSWIKNNKSIVEFKPAFEYRNILDGIAPGEKRESFYASGELRIRVTDNLWIPLAIKYDLKKGNFLGFLNVSLNMNTFRKS